MAYTDPALTFAEFSARLEVTPDNSLHIDRSGTGHAVVLLHGLAASSWSWHDVVDARRDGFETVCIDLLGHGESPKPRHNAYSVYDHARHVVHAIETLGVDNVTLVGNSLGGGCALLNAVALTQRQKVTIRRIILLEGIGVRQMTPLPFYLARIPWLPDLMKRFVPHHFSARLALRACYADASRITATQVAAYAAPAKDPNQSRAAIRSARYVKPDDVDALPDRYRDITAETLMIWGDRGNIVPLSVAETLYAILPSSQIQVVTNCGHIPHEECPERVVPMIWDFIESGTTDPA